MILEQILLDIDSATASHLLQTYFKFHSRSGFIHESLVIERLLSLKPKSSDESHIKFLLELLFETLKTLRITADQGIRFAKELNRLAKWLCQALCLYANDLLVQEHSMIIAISNLFLLLFTNPTFYCLWLMIIKGSKEQNLWRQYQEQLAQVNKRLLTSPISRPEVYEQISFK